VSGGNSDKITTNSFLLRLQYRIREDEYLQNQADYSQYLAEVAEKGFENVIAARSSYLTDPLTFASLIRSRPVLMLNASFDEIIPKLATLDLWESYGKPSIEWYPATHASIWLWYPCMGPKIAGFLKSVYQ
jgi:hypothetical protein